MTEFAINFALRFFWPSALAVLVVAYATISSWGQRPGRTVVLALALAAILIAPCGWVIYEQAHEPKSNVLVRDIVGWLVVGTAAPLLAALTAALVRRFARRWAAGAAAILVGLAWVLGSPFFLLAIHCTSGDCL